MLAKYCITAFKVKNLIKKIKICLKLSLGGLEISDKVWSFMLFLICKLIYLKKKKKKKKKKKNGSFWDFSLVGLNWNQIYASLFIKAPNPSWSPSSSLLPFPPLSCFLHCGLCQYSYPYRYGICQYSYPYRCGLWQYSYPYSCGLCQYS